MHYLITCVDSREKHGLEGFVIRNEDEKAAYREMAEYAFELAEDWAELIVAVCSVGGPDDPDEDGELISTSSFRGPNRAANMRDSLLWREENTKNLKEHR